MSTSEDLPPPLYRHYVGTTLGVGIALTIMVTISVALRLYCRYLRGLRLAIDDHLMIASLLTYYVATVTLFLLVFKYGLGLHFWQLSPEQVKGWVQTSLAGSTGYTVNITLTRMSICFLFLRAFNIRYYRICVYVTMFLNMSYFVTAIFLIYFRCVPFSKNLNPDKPGHCMNENAFLVVGPAYALVCDILTWAVPLPVVWRLNLRFYLRVVLSGVFALGLVVVAVDGVRIYTAVVLNGPDVSYDSRYMCWAMLEPGVAMICACAPTYRPLIDLFRNSKLSDPFAAASTQSGPFSNYEHIPEHARVGPYGVQSGLGPADSRTSASAYAFPLTEQSSQGMEMSPRSPKNGEITTWREVSVTAESGEGSSRSVTGTRSR